MAPPLDEGAVNVTTAPPSVGIATGVLGAVGTSRGVTEFVVAAEEDPTPLAATTLNVYAMPLVRPLTMHDVAGALTVQLPPDGEEVTVYEVTAEPPFNEGGAKETVALPAPATAETFVGALGALAGVNPPEGVEEFPVPAAFVAAAEKV